MKINHYRAEGLHVFITKNTSGQLNKAVFYGNGHLIYVAGAGTDDWCNFVEEQCWKFGTKNNLFINN